MIEVETGRIRFPMNEVNVGPSLSLKQFLASTSGSLSQQLVHNGPFRSFSLPPSNFGGRTFSWGLSFEGSKLRSVSISCVDPEFEASWADWSEEKELARKRLHDELLESQFGKGWNQLKLKWGSIDSTYDPRSGTSNIIVSYAP